MPTSPSLDLNAVACFIRVAEHLSITKAAQALKLPKSNLSRKLSELERALGLKLVHRTTRNLRLTEAGQAFLARCGGLLSQVSDAQEAVHRFRTTPHGRIRVAVPNDYGVAVVGKWVTAFARASPDIQVDLYCSDDVVDMVGGGFDCAIRVGKVTDAALTTQKVGKIEGILAAAPEYVARRGTPSHPSELRSHACVVFNQPPFSRTWSFSAKGETVQVDVDGPIAVNSLIVAREAVLAGLGIGRMPAYACEADIAASRLVRLMPDWMLGERPVFIAWPFGRQVPAKVRAFIDFVRQYTRSAT